MKFYRLHRTRDNGSSIGYDWFTSKAAADKEAKEYKGIYPDEAADVTRHEIKPTKKGILAALNKFAGHPDNG